jgi:hypothetical protein
MSAAPAAPYLTEFDCAAGPSVLAVVGQLGLSDEEQAAARLAEAHAEGFEKGKAAALATVERKLAEQSAQFQQQLVRERAAWAAGQGDKLAGALAAALEALESRIADAVSSILTPFVEARLRGQAVAELRAELDALLASEPEIGLSVAGPDDLLAALRSRLSGQRCSVTYSASETCDVSVNAGQTLLQTRLEAWKARIEEAAA